MNSHDHEVASPVVASPVGGLRSGDELQRVVSELLDLAAGQDQITRQCAQLADRLQALADAHGWLAGERESLGEEPAALPWRQLSGVQASASLPRRMRCPGDPGS